MYEQKSNAGKKFKDGPSKSVDAYYQRLEKDPSAIYSQRKGNAKKKDGKPVDSLTNYKDNWGGTFMLNFTGGRYMNDSGSISSWPSSGLEPTHRDFYCYIQACKASVMSYKQNRGGAVYTDHGGWKAVMRDTFGWINATGLYPWQFSIYPSDHVKFQKKMFDSIVAPDMKKWFDEGQSVSWKIKHPNGDGSISLPKGEYDGIVDYIIHDAIPFLLDRHGLGRPHTLAASSAFQTEVFTDYFTTSDVQAYWFCGCLAGFQVADDGALNWKHGWLASKRNNLYKKTWSAGGFNLARLKYGKEPFISAAGLEITEGLWDKYLMALANGKAAAEAGLTISADSFIQDLFNYADSARAKVKYTRDVEGWATTGDDGWSRADLDSPYSFVGDSESRYSFPYYYKSKGKRNNILANLSNIKLPNNKWHDNTVGPHLASYSKGGSSGILSWSIYTPEDVKAWEERTDQADVTKKGVQKSHDSFMSAVYKKMNKLIGKEKKKWTVTDGTGTSHEIDSDGTIKDWLKSKSIGSDQLPKMMINWVKKQSADATKISATHPQISKLLTGNLANYKQSAKWRTWATSIYVDIFSKYTAAWKKWIDAGTSKYSTNEDYTNALRGNDKFEYGPSDSSAYNEVMTAKGGDPRMWMTQQAIATAIQKDAGAVLIAYLGAEFVKNWVIAATAMALLNGPDKPLPEDAFSDAEAEALNDTLASDAVGADKPVTTTGLSEKEVQERQSFREQCALLADMPRFVTENKLKIALDLQNGSSANSSCAGGVEVHKKYPYSGRFWMLQDAQASGQSSIINKLYVPRDLSALQSLTPADVALLTPMVRLYKIYDEGSKPKQVEFEFDQRGLSSGKLSPIDRINNLFKTSFDRGSGAGIKDFSFSFEGTSPATARKDIVADLTLYFASFTDFFRSRKNSLTGEEYSYLDLVLYPQANRKKGIDDNSRLSYRPADYRIRADVGWSVPDPDIMNQLSQNHKDPKFKEKLKTEIERVNKSFYLNRVDEEISLKDDGSVEIKIKFRAYLESLLETNEMDALQSKQVKKIRKQREAKLADARKKKCTTQEIKAIKDAFEKQDEQVMKIAHRSIMKRLLERKKIYYCDLAFPSKKFFQLYGYFGENMPEWVSPVKESSGVVTTNSNKNGVKKELEEKNKTGKTQFAVLNTDFVEQNIGQNQRINFFFLGDLVYTMLDSLYDDKGIPSSKMKLLLCSFEYVDSKGNLQIANMADIPISCKYFFEWYTKNVIEKERRAYPIVYFLRNLCNHLINELLGEVCENKSTIRKIRFNTTTLFCPSVNKGKDPFSTTFPSHKAMRPENLCVNVDKHYRGASPLLPLYTEKIRDTDINDMYNYFLIYPIIKPNMKPPGRGDVTDDKNRGIHHFHIGSPVGLVKKMSFAKTDIAYLREARWLNQGDQGLMQLGAVYKVTIEMVGNTIWYPGMEIYINPLGIGGTEFGSPTQGGGTNPRTGKKEGLCIANALGFGGYHEVLRVKTTIAPGKFNTTVIAQFVYAGDGKAGVKMNDEKVDATPSKEDLKAKPSSKTVSQECSQIIQKIREETDLINSGTGNNIDKEETSTGNGGNPNNKNSTNASEKDLTEAERTTPPRKASEEEIEEARKDGRIMGAPPSDEEDAALAAAINERERLMNEYGT